MYTGLLHTHSLLRWIALILLVITIIDSYGRIYRPLKGGNPKFHLFTLISIHLQLVIGFLLYFISPFMKGVFADGSVMKNSVHRFYAVEHLAMMLIAIALITIGYSKAKRKEEISARHKIIFRFYLIAFILIMLAIPWPFREVGEFRGWF